MSVEQEILVTGIKVVDLLAPYAKGGKIGEWTIKVLEFYAFDLQSVLVLGLCSSLICFSHGVSTSALACVYDVPS